MDTTTDAIDLTLTVGEITSALTDAGFRDVAVVDDDGALLTQVLGALTPNGTPISIVVNVTT